MTVTAVNGNRQFALVAAYTDHQADKHALLDRVLGEADFYTVLEQAWRSSGKSQADFLIAVKPNLSMMLRRADEGTYSDTSLVIHLLRRLAQGGFTRLAVVESQNLYGNWFENRGVTQVAARAGYFDGASSAPPDAGADPGADPCAYAGPAPGRGAEKQRPIHLRGEGVDLLVPLVDLTLDKVAGRLGQHSLMLGRTWLEADFRISFARMKTHFYGSYTLAIKNIYGCLPEQDKVRAYHCRKGVARFTAALIRQYPVHFAIVDGYLSADGWFGVKMKAIPRKTHTMLAGADLLAVDAVGSRLIGLSPEASVLYQALARLKPPAAATRVVGNAVPCAGWSNVPSLFVRFSELVERNAQVMDYCGMLSTGGNDPCFPRQSRSGQPLSGQSMAGGAPASAGLWSRLAGAGGLLSCLLKSGLYAASVPLVLLADSDILRFRLRRLRFSCMLGAMRSRWPTIAASPLLLDRLSFLAPDDMHRLADILARGMAGETRCSGHILFSAGQEIPFPARLFGGVLAAVDVLNHVHQSRLPAGAVAGELRTLAAFYRRLLGKEERYPYCYR